jgi:ferredoxin-thioredoxin reductase catalytic subunit
MPRKYEYKLCPCRDSNGAPHEQESRLTVVQSCYTVVAAIAVYYATDFQSM